MSQYVVKVLIYSAQPASRSVTVSHCVPAPSSKPKRFKFTFETAVKSCHHVVFTGKVFQSRGPKLLSPKSEDVVSAWNRPVGIDLQTNRTDGDSFLINCLSAVSFFVVFTPENAVVCRNFATDADCRHQLPIHPHSKDLYVKCSDGILLWSVHILLQN